MLARRVSLNVGPNMTGRDLPSAHSDAPFLLSQNMTRPNQTEGTYKEYNKVKLNLYFLVLLIDDVTTSHVCVYSVVCVRISKQQQKLIKMNNFAKVQRLFGTLLIKNYLAPRTMSRFVVKGVHEPEYLDLLKPRIPFYPLLNIQVCFVFAL